MRIKENWNQSLFGYVPRKPRWQLKGLNLPQILYYCGLRLETKYFPFFVFYFRRKRFALQKYSIYDTDPLRAKGKFILTHRDKKLLSIYQLDGRHANTAILLFAFGWYKNWHKNGLKKFQRPNMTFEFLPHSETSKMSLHHAKKKQFWLTCFHSRFSSGCHHKYCPVDNTCIFRKTSIVFFRRYNARAGWPLIENNFSLFNTETCSSLNSRKNG